MLRLFFATNNSAKRIEIADFAKQYGIEVIFPPEGNNWGEPIEDGDTFEDNARIKARFYQEKIADKDLVYVGDDTGVEIPALNNEPGVKTRRWIGRHMTDRELIDYTLKRLDGETDRRAVFKTTMVALLPDGTEQIYTGERWGRINEAEDETQDYLEGFPFRKLFVDEETNESIAHVQDSKSSRVRTHRQKALHQLITSLK